MRREPLRHRPAHPPPLRLALTRRALEDPVHGQCGVCREPRRLEPLVLLGADELAVCRECYEAVGRFRRLSGGRPLLFDTEQA